jgi:hypothetical protein
MSQSQYPKDGIVETSPEGSNMEFTHTELVPSQSEFDAPLLSLRELVVKSILSSRNCHRIIQLYDYCNISGQVDAAALAKEFISDKFAFFVDRYLSVHSGSEHTALVLPDCIYGI